MLNCKLFSILIICFLLSYNICFSENTTAITLNDAVNTALFNNKTFENVQKSLKEAQFAYNSSAKERLPKLFTKYGYMRFNQDFNITATNPIDNSLIQLNLLNKNNYMWNSTLAVPLYTGRSLELSEEVAKLGIDVAKMRLIKAKNELIYSVKFYYLNILKNIKFTNFLEQNLKNYKEHRELSVKYYKEGLVAKNSILEAEAETANAMQEFLSVQKNEEVLNSSLNAIMGINLNKKNSVKDFLEKKNFTFSLSDCIEYAKKNNPDLVAFTYLKKQAEKAVQIEQAYYIPRIDLSLNYMKYGNKPNLSGYDGLPNNLLYSMLDFSWNVFDWGQKRDEVKIKKSQLEQVMNNEKTVCDNTVVKIREFYAQKDAAENNIETAKLQINAAQENLRIIKIRYKEQESPSYEVINAITALKRAEYNYYTALYDYNIAVAGLENIMGMDLISNFNI